MREKNTSMRSADSIRYELRELQTQIRGLSSKLALTQKLLERKSALEIQLSLLTKGSKIESN